MTPRTTAATRQRESLTALFADRASYVILRYESKEPQGKYRRRNGKTPPSRKKEIPLRGNYGILPEKDFFVLDLDVHRSDVREQVAFFEALFGVNLNETLCVRTPSGGMHYYLRLPAGSDAVFNGSLRSYVKILNEHSAVKLDYIDADIRSSDATGYVVGPNSVVTVGKNGATYETPGEYKLQGKSQKIIASGDFNSLAEISKAGLSLLTHLREVQIAKKGPKKEKGTDEVDPLLNAKRPPASVIKRLKRRLDTSLEYHRQRFFVYKALHCCYGDYGIAGACEELNIARDSYTSEKISFWETVGDIHRLRGPAATQHGAYCEKGFALRHPETQSDPIDIQAKIKMKIATRTLARLKHQKEPRVINIDKALRMLDTQTPKVPQRVSDAVLLLDVLFQPLVNVGAIRVVVAKKPVAEKIGLNNSRLTEALRLLREKKIIIVKDKQRPGLAATYAIGSEFLNRRLTGGIKHRWSQIRKHRGEAVPLLYDRWTNSFLELHTKKAYKADAPRASWRKEFSQKPLVEMDIFAQSYMQQELAKLVDKNQKM